MCEQEDEYLKYLDYLNTLRNPYIKHTLHKADLTYTYNNIVVFYLQAVFPTLTTANAYAILTQWRRKITHAQESSREP